MDNDSHIKVLVIHLCHRRCCGGLDPGPLYWPKGVSRGDSVVASRHWSTSILQDSYCASIALGVKRLRNKSRKSSLEQTYDRIELPLSTFVDLASAPHYPASCRSWFQARRLRLELDPNLLKSHLLTHWSFTKT